VVDPALALDADHARTFACKSAVKSRRPLSKEPMKKIFGELETNNNSCPTRQTVKIEVSTRMFRRLINGPEYYC
jgi:hypothetical protein